MNIYQKLPKPFFVLAPMDDVTDSVFRKIIFGLAKPDLCFTEFVNVDGLQSPGRAKLIHKLQYSKFEKPIIAQIWGKKPVNYYKTAKELVEMGFDGVDINMGCPEKSVVKNGCCIALINDRPLAADIIQATKEGLNSKLPISVKTRLGFDSVDLSWPEFLLEQNLDALTIHGRTKKQLSSVAADWKSIGQIGQIRNRVAPETRIIGNGDIWSRKQGLELAEKYKIDGIMIGRGVLHDPFVFSDKSKWLNYTAEAKKELYSKHIKLFAKTWQKGERNTLTLRKFCKLYINGFDGAKELREQLMLASTVKDMLSLL